MCVPGLQSKMQTNGEDLVLMTCCIYCGLFVVSGMVNLIALTLTMPVYLYFNDTEDSMWKRENPIFSFALDVAGRIVETISTLVAACVIYLFSAVSILLPLFMFIVLLSLLNANLDTALQTLVTVYNQFVVHTNAIGVIRRSAWIFKTTFEIVTPLYNWLVDTLLNINIDLLKLFVDNDGNRGLITSIMQDTGYFFIVLSKSAADWLYVNMNECEHDNIMRDITVLQRGNAVLQHRCYDFDYLDMDVAPAVIIGQKIVASTHSLTASLCPILSPISALVLYPFYDSHMNKIVQNTLNLGLGVFYTVKVTQSRCRASLSLSLSTTLCVPDVFPMFRYVERIIDATGQLVDNWLNIMHMMLLSFFMNRDPSVMEKCNSNRFFSVSAGSTNEIFAGRATKLVPMTENMLAVTDGVNAVYMDKYTPSTPPVETRNAFRIAVDLTFGIAAVDFAGTLLESDGNGNTKTGMLGCRCTDDQALGVIISCSVALFPVFFDVESDVQDMDTLIPVLFERGTSARLLQCQYLRIQVESVRFPAQVFDTAQAAGDDTASSYNYNSNSACLIDPKQCNVIDAIVYVMPLCPSFLNTEQDTGVQCIQDSKYQTCFPYCAALHQKGAGNSVMTLYNKRTLSRGGVYMANTNYMKNTAQSLSMRGDTRNAAVTETYQGSSDTLFASRVTGINSLVRDTDAVGPASYDDTKHSVQSVADDCDDIDHCADDVFAEASVPADIRATHLAQSQPFLFAGDVILVQECALEGTKCFWTTSMFRVTSDLFSRYSILNKMSKIPSIRTSDASVQSEHGGVIMPGESNDVVTKRNPATQTQSGIVYGVNPNPLPFRGRLQQCATFLAQATVLELNCNNCYQTPQVFYTQPYLMCSSDYSNTVEDQNSKTVRSCKFNTTVEIEFTGTHKFWSVAEPCRGVNGGFHYNLFIEDIVYIDGLNVAISVKRGPIIEFLWLAGLNRTVWPSDREMQSKTIHYFLNMRTLQIQTDVAWKVPVSQETEGRYSILCQSDTLVPEFASFAASIATGVHVHSP